MTYGIELLIMMLMLVINAVFSAYEMALASVPRSKLMAFAHLNRKGAQEALYMKDRMEGSLAVAQLSITLAAAIAAAIGGAGVDEHLTPYLKSHWHLSQWLAGTLSLVILVIPLSAITLIFAELIPKTFAINNAAKVSLALSPIMKILVGIGYPVISVLERIVKAAMRFMERRSKKNHAEEGVGLHELNAAVSLARTSRLLGAHQEKIVISAAQLSVRPVKEIMIPMSDVNTVPLDATLTQALIQAHNDMHTRFPVRVKDSNPPLIEGYINFKDIMAGLKLNPSDPSIKGIMRPIRSVSENAFISSALEKMMSEKLHIIMITSAKGEIIGMVTLEDIIEQMVGEIEDEFDRLPAYIHPYGNGWIVGGGLTMVALSEAMERKGTFSDDEGKMKFCDWLGMMWGKPLLGGEVLELKSMSILVRKLRRKRLGEAIVTPI